MPAADPGDEAGGGPPAETHPAARPAIATTIPERRRTPTIGMQAP
jgi:hypothetical protein